MAVLRRPLRVICALSAGVSLLAIGFFIRSFFSVDYLFRSWISAPNNRYCVFIVRAGRGRALAMYAVQANDPARASTWKYFADQGWFYNSFSPLNLPPAGTLDTAFIRLSRSPNGGPPPNGCDVVFEIRLWPIALLTAIPPILSSIHHRRRQRRLSVGRCRKCGYDLRASKTLCPECGTPIPTVTQSA